MIATLTILVIYLACGVQFAALVERKATPGRRKAETWITVVVLWLPVLLWVLGEVYWVKAHGRNYRP